MTDLRKAAEMALEALKDTHYRIIDAGLIDQDLLNRNFTVATALRQALYVDKVYMSEKHVHKSDKFIHEREWVELADVEVAGLICECVDDRTFNMSCAHDFARSIEKALKEKNT